MDDLSSIWMSYYAAADAAATRGGMYLKNNIFLENGHEKVTLFFEKICFRKRKLSFRQNAIFHAV